MPKKILIIDDSEQDIKIMRRHLQRVGFVEIADASTADEGFALARSFLPDIVILDTVLPGADGFETCRSIKAMEGVNAKVIMTTGNIIAVDALKAKEAGADEYCGKTSDGAQLLEVIGNLFP